MTATALGRELGHTAREINKLLKDHGFMEGDPGAYRPTALGEAFAKAHDFDNGYGGFAHRQWGWLSWGDGIIDALKASIEANPNGLAATAPQTAAKILSPATAPQASSGGPGLRTGLAAVAAFAALGVTTPGARRIWTEKIRPAASNVRNRFGKTDPADEGGPSEPGSDGLDSSDG